jgi:bacillopeptidase F
MLADMANGDWSSWTFDALFVNGNNTVTARAMDTSGNTGFDYLTVIASSDLNDTTPPEVRILSPVDGAVVNMSHPIIVGTAKDTGAASGGVGGILRVDVSVNDGPWEPAGGTTDWTFPATLVAGSNVIKVRATDLSANTNTTQITVTLNESADLVFPTLAITSPKDNSTTSSDKLDIKGTASDDQMLDRVELTLNGNKMAVTGTTDWKSRVTLKEGANEIVVTAYDAGGNSVSRTLTVNYKKPEPPPFIPGFEALFLVAALLMGAVLLGLRRRA